MINVTDIILTLIAVYLFLLGFTRGFLRSIFGPIALIVGTWLAWMYYQATHQSFASICIGLIAPMVLSILLRFVLAGWLKSLNPDEKLGIISRCAGALITFIWGWVFVILMVVCLEVFPGINPTIEKMQTSINTSNFAKLTIAPFKYFIIPAPKPSATAKPVSMEELAKDPRLAALLNDPEIQDAAAKKDFVELLKNPKVMTLTQEMMKDPELMQKMMSMYQHLQKSQQIHPKTDN